VRRLQWHARFRLRTEVPASQRLSPANGNRRLTPNLATVPAASPTIGLVRGARPPVASLAAPAIDACASTTWAAPPWNASSAATAIIDKYRLRSPALNMSQAPGTKCMTTSAPVARASFSNRRRVGSIVVWTAHSTATLPPPRTASRASMASTRNIGTDAATAAASAAGPRVEHVRRTASASSHMPRRTPAVRSAISGVSPPACSAAARRSARTLWWSSTPSMPSSCKAMSKTWMLLSAVCRQAMRGMGQCLSSRRGAGERRSMKPPRVELLAILGDGPENPRTYVRAIRRPRRLMPSAIIASGCSE